MTQTSQTKNKAYLKSTNEVKKTFLIAFIPSFIYAVLRYNIFKEVPWSQTPLWVSNKAFAVTATIMISLSFALPANRPRREIGLWGFYIAVIHVILSFLLLLLGNYEKFYQENGFFSLPGGLSLLAGVVSFTALIFAFKNSFAKWRSTSKVNLNFIHKVVLLALFFNLAHLTLMSSQSWIDISHWPAYLPPITLISVIISFYFISKRLLQKKLK
jgi:DMSO/TMAO reductase YedYZ heme-binding membrane subunit